MTSLQLQLRQIRLEADGIASFELADPDGAPLPAFTGGAHIDIQIPDGPRRSYSISSAPDLPSHYRITVKRDPASRGGSAWFHEHARVGMRFAVHGPRNEFTLNEAAPHSVLVAGGIGITPLLPMISRLTELGRPWSLHYSTRTRREMAFEAELLQLQEVGAGALRRYFTAEDEARMDFCSIIGTAPANSHFYCCGPAPFIDAFLAATHRLAPSFVHYERFSASQAPAEGGYTLVLARDGRRLTVAPGRSMLDTLLDAGLDLPYSCTQGVCGSCRLDVLDGRPDHRDECLSEEERVGNRMVIPCCSGATTPELVLDL